MLLSSFWFAGDEIVSETETKQHGRKGSQGKKGKQAKGRPNSHWLPRRSEKKHRGLLEQPDSERKVRFCFVAFFVDKEREEKPKRHLERLKSGDSLLWMSCNSSYILHLWAIPILGSPRNNQFFRFSVLFHSWGVSFLKSTFFCVHFSMPQFIPLEICWACWVSRSRLILLSPRLVTEHLTLLVVSSQVFLKI